MKNIYAMSDIHGNQEVFEETFNQIIRIDLESNKDSKLILIGDYLDRFDKSIDILLYLKELQEKYENQIILCLGNHELEYLNEVNQEGTFPEEIDIVEWLKSLPYYHETEEQIYVHAGVDEEAEQTWRYSPSSYFCNKYPPVMGKFYKDIIAGHVYTNTIANDENYNKVYWDDESHFYIDGNTEETNFIPVLKYNTLSKRYTSFEQNISTNEWIEYIIK